jgi:DNA-directed RNA polymerase specialized sigma24 family protein
MAYTEDLEHAEHISDGDYTDKNLHYNDLLAMVQKLPQAYRTVFNLFAIDGYSHDEIGEMLNINAGTSKSNLFKARQKLKQMILNADTRANNINYNNDIDYAPIVAINGGSVKQVFYNNGIRE